MAFYNADVPLRNYALTHSLTHSPFLPAIQAKIELCIIQERNNTASLLINSLNTKLWYRGLHYEPVCGTVFRSFEKHCCTFAVV